MLRGCAIFHPPRFLQTIRLWFLPVPVLMLSVLTLFALMEHAQLEQIKLGSTIHAPFTEVFLFGPNLLCHQACRGH